MAWLTHSAVLAAQPVAAVGARVATPRDAAEPVRTRALARFHRGAAAFDEGRYKDAIDLFLEADRLVRSPALAFNTAVAYEQMGDKASGLAWYREYLRRAPEAPDRPRIAERIARLEQALARRGLQQVTVLAFPEGATVVLDGAPVGVAPWTAELPPGGHQLQLRLRGYEDADARFELGAHHAMDVCVDLRPGPGTRGMAGWRQGATELAPWAWTTLGVGVAGLGAAVGFEVASASAEDDAQSASTPMDAEADHDRMSDLRAASRALIAIGAAATLAGGVLLVVDLTAPPDEQAPRPDDADAQGALRCSAVMCTLGLSGRF
jgi:tetratricopeptide (TPR) repeat protein